jgi:hypothetical protein
VPIILVRRGADSKAGCPDEIIVRPHERETRALDDLSDDELFAPLIGKHIEYVWWMTNHRGYQDGLQIRLLALDVRSEVTRQFEVAASAISVRTVADR